MKGISVTNIRLPSDNTLLSEIRLAADQALQAGDVSLARQLQEQAKAKARTFLRLYNTLMDAAANAKAR